MSDYEHQELENKIHNLERKIDDLDYQLRQVVERLELTKAEKYHTHSQY